MIQIPDDKFSSSATFFSVMCLINPPNTKVGRRSKKQTHVFFLRFYVSGPDFLVCLSNPPTEKTVGRRAKKKKFFFSFFLSAPPTGSVGAPPVPPPHGLRRGALLAGRARPGQLPRGEGVRGVENPERGGGEGGLRGLPSYAVFRRTIGETGRGKP